MPVLIRSNPVQKETASFERLSTARDEFVRRSWVARALSPDVPFALAGLRSLSAAYSVRFETRNTSSSVVMPRRAFAIPSSNMTRIPWLTAARRISWVAAP
jgi:hypothetical protein